MRRALQWVVGIVLGLVVASVLACVVLSRIGASQFRQRFEAEKSELHARSRAAEAVGIASRALHPLPLPVRRYLEVTGSNGQLAARVAMLEQRGTLRMAPDKPWIPFTAEQVYSFAPPGFLWMANARVAPLVPMLARDRFVADRGNMLVRLLGVFTVADASGREIDQGAALRYWGEIVCFPASVLDPALQWEAIDDHRARLVVTLAGSTVQAVVEFDDAGLLTAVHADRWRDVGGKGVLTPWSGTSRNWKDFNGRLFPAQWESVWHLPEGDFTAVRIENLRLVTE